MTKSAMRIALGAIAVLGPLVFASTDASAAIVCNREGECWHVKGRYSYQPSLHLTIHTDSWKWGTHDKYKWHEHDGNGYWKGGVWLNL
jgi:hypothetical protein